MKHNSRAFNILLWHFQLKNPILTCPSWIHLDTVHGWTAASWVAVVPHGHCSVSTSWPYSPLWAVLHLHCRKFWFCTNGIFWPAIFLTSSAWKMGSKISWKPAFLSDLQCFSWDQKHEPLMQYFGTFISTNQEIQRKCKNWKWQLNIYYLFHTKKCLGQGLEKGFGQFFF